jgi:hypothetical protein
MVERLILLFNSLGVQRLAVKAASDQIYKISFADKGAESAV